MNTNDAVGEKMEHKNRITSFPDFVQGGNMKCLQIIEIATNKVEKEFDITGESESYIDKLEMGLARQLNWDLYRIAFEEKDDLQLNKILCLQAAKEEK